MTIEKMDSELQKTYAKIEELKAKARDLEEQKKQAEDMEYIKIIRKHGISSEDLQVLIELGNEEQKTILQNREKEQTHENEKTI